jgi:hypothetical protein
LDVFETFSDVGMVCVHHLNLHIILDFKDYFCGKDNSVIIGSVDSLDYQVIPDISGMFGFIKLDNETQSQQPCPTC